MYRIDHFVGFLERVFLGCPLKYGVDSLGYPEIKTDMLLANFRNDYDLFSRGLSNFLASRGYLQGLFMIVCGCNASSHRHIKIYITDLT